MLIIPGSLDIVLQLFYAQMVSQCSYSDILNQSLSFSIAFNSHTYIQAVLSLWTLGMESQTYIQTNTHFSYSKPGVGLKFYVSHYSPGSIQIMFPGLL